MIPCCSRQGPRIAWATCFIVIATTASFARDLDPDGDGRIMLVAQASATTAVEPSSTPAAARSAADTIPDPLKGTQQIDPATTGVDAEKVLQRMLPPRSDAPADWNAGIEPLHDCGEPRLLTPCVPPPPCHPSQPPRPYDLVGVRGMPTCGPRYRGPCDPRTGSHDNAHLPRVHRWHDRLFDWFYTAK